MKSPEPLGPSLSRPRLFRAQARGGFLLVLVPVLLLVVLAGIFTLNYLSRTQYRRAHSLRIGQEATYLAEGGMNLTRQWFEGPDGRTFLSGLAALAVEELDISAAAWPRVDIVEELQVPSLELLRAGFPEAELSAKVRLTTAGPLRAPALPEGLVTDPLEAEATLEILFRCDWQHITRVVRGRFGARLMSMQPPLVSRFALIVREAGEAAAAVNCLDYDSGTGLFRDAVSGARTSPLEVHSLPDAPWVEQRRRAAGDRAFPEGAPPAARAGWTYLGGPEPWFLNLTAGSSATAELEEQALLGRHPYLLPVSGIGAEFQEKVFSSGFARGASTLAMLGFAGSRWVSPTSGEPVPERTAFLHLAGDAASPSPPVVLGPAFRRFISFSKLRRGGSGPFYSFVQTRDEEEYRQVAPPFEQLTGMGYAQYRKVMARVVEEPYNRSYDFLVAGEALSETPPGDEPAVLPAVPPLLLEGSFPTDLRPAGTEPGFLYPSPGTRAAAPVRIRRVAGGTAVRTLFVGDPGALGGFDDHMLGRVTKHLPASGDETGARLPPELLRQAALGLQLDLGGHTVHVADAGLRLPAVRVVGGGTILADGDVTLEGPIECAGGELLAVVSLKGSIHLKTPGPIQAALIAPNGQIRPPPAGGLELRGLAVCRNLDNFPEWNQNPGRKKVLYDPLLNCTAEEVRRGSYRLVLTGSEEKFLERK